MTETWFSEGFDINLLG